MKKKLFFMALFTALAVSVGIGVGTASATTPISSTPFTATFATTTPYGSVTWNCAGFHFVYSSTLSEDSELCGLTGDMQGFVPGTYSGDPRGVLPPYTTIANQRWTSDYNGAYASSWTIKLSNPFEGVWVARVDSWYNTATSPMPKPQANGSFLCYSVGGNPLYAGDEATAMADMQSGYWLPEAVVGNVAGGTNLGAYHLDCNNQPVSGAFGNTIASAMYVDQNGDVLPGAYVMGSITDGLGTYPILG